MTTTSRTENAAMSILVALSFSHLLNDMIQSLLPAIYPILKRDYELNFTQIGPLLAAFIILPYGQKRIAIFSLAALLAIIVLSYISRWYRNYHINAAKKIKAAPAHTYSRNTVIGAMFVLMFLVFSKYFYMSSLTSYYTFYLMEKFKLTEQDAQLHLFLFLAAVAAGTLAGGPIGDRIGRKLVIWISILGVLPFTLALPYANLLGTEILSVIIGLIISSAFSAIIVYAQELAPGRTGMIAGLFFGFAFGIAGIGAAICGHLADTHGIEYVYNLASYLPAAGILAIFLPGNARKV